jgi:hypothetical protein
LSKQARFPRIFFARKSPGDLRAAVGANSSDKSLALESANIREGIRSAFWRPGQQTEGCHRLVSSLVRVGKPFLLAACGDK